MKDTVLAWKKYLQREENYSPSTVNASLAALNYLFNFLGWADCRTHYLKIQRRLFRETGRELDRADYEKLIAAALGLGRERIALVMETICATGIRVGEVRYITVEAVRAGSATISLKGKIRTILLPGKLCKKLLKYARKNKIASGELFLTRSGRPLSRKQIWAEMKAICEKAGVEPGKVFPHNLRHLFARTFYKVCRDVARLADVLGLHLVDLAHDLVLYVPRLRQLGVGVDARKEDLLGQPQVRRYEKVLADLLKKRQIACEDAGVLRLLAEEVPLCHALVQSQLVVEVIVYGSPGDIELIGYIIEVRPLVAVHREVLEGNVKNFLFRDLELLRCSAHFASSL